MKIRVKIASRAYKTTDEGYINVPIWLEDGSLRHWKTKALTLEEAIRLNHSWIIIDTETSEITATNDRSPIPMKQLNDEVKRWCKI